MADDTPTMSMAAYLKVVDQAADLERQLKAVDDAIAEARDHLLSGIDSCMTCKDDEIPCSVCMEGARFLGTLEHLRTKAKVTDAVS